MGYLIALGVIAALWVAGTLHGDPNAPQKSAAPPAAATAQAPAPAPAPVPAAPQERAARGR
jgi:hypothetical protein